MDPRGKDDRFSMYVPKDEDGQEMPENLELIDSRKRKRLQGGAYDPYQKLDAGHAGDTTRIRRPRVDLRKLSEWIKTTKRVKALRDDDLAAAAAKSKSKSNDKSGK